MIRKGLDTGKWFPILLFALGINIALYGAMTKLSHRKESGLQQRYEKAVILTLPEKRPPVEKQKRRPLKKKSLKMKKMENLALKRPQVKPPRFEFSKPAGGLSVAAVFTDSISQNIPVFQAPKMLFNLSELDQKPRLLYRVNPVYPYAAKRRNLTGDLLLQFIVDDSGYVGHVKVIKSQPKGIFDESAIRAVKKWRFKPGYVEGEAVSTRVIVPINFRI